MIVEILKVPSTIMSVDVEINEANNYTVFNLCKALYSLFEAVIDNDENRLYATGHFSFFQNQVIFFTYAYFIYLSYRYLLIRVLLVVFWNYSKTTKL